MTNDYWNSTHSCLKDLKYTNVNITDYRVCKRFSRCHSSLKDPYSLYNTTLLFKDYGSFSLPKNTVSLISNTLSIPFVDMNQVYSTFFKLLLNPNREVMNLLLKDIHTMKSQQGVVGIHVRSGGDLANRRERTRWMKKDSLPFLTQFINRTIESNHHPHTIYLTTDSDIVEMYFKEHLPHFLFLEKNPYKRGHTTSGAKGVFIKGAIYDVIMTSQASVLFLSPSSSFSSMIRLISKSGRSYNLPLYRA